MGSAKLDVLVPILLGSTVELELVDSYKLILGSLVEVGATKVVSVELVSMLLKEMEIDLLVSKPLDCIVELLDSISEVV